MQEILAKLEERRANARQGGGQARIDAQHRRGKLTARERIDLLLDEGSFEEFDMFVEHRCTDFGMEKAKVPGDGVVTGWGTVNGRTVYVFAKDFTVFGGSLSEAHARKIIKIQDMALQNRAPIVGLFDAGGARIQEGVAALGGYGEVFLRNVLASGVIPQISVIMGPCAGGDVYSPAMTDFIFMVRDTSYMFVTGPDVVKAATGEEVTAEELGGADVHTRMSGVADYFAEDDVQALEMCRTVMSTLNTVKRLPADMTAPEDPRYDPAEIYGIVSADSRKGYDVREIIARIVDGSRFDEFKQRYGTTLVTGFARLHGFLVGIIANNGVLFSESALKATHFMELCNLRGIPLVFLQNITGFIVGRQYERAGIAKDGAKMVHAVANSVVPKFTVVIGGSFGAGNYGMCGRAYEPRLLWMWPNARISVMGAQQAAAVLTTVKRDQLTREGKPFSAEDEEAIRQPILDKYEFEGSPYYSTARLWDDGILDPAETRQALALGLSAAFNAPIPEPKFGVFRM